MLERKGKRVWKKEDCFTQRTFGTSLVAQGLEFWSFTIMAQVPSLVGKLRSCTGWPKEKKILVIGVCVWRWGGCLSPFEGQVDTVYYNTKMSTSYNQENHFFESAEA